MYVTAVIVAWNCCKDVLALLESVYTLNYKPNKIILVDNASEDDLIEITPEKYPLVEMLVLSENTGGAGGFSAGVELALKNPVCDFVWLLDSDSIVGEKALSALLKIFEDSDDIGAVGSQILNMHDRDRIQETGALYDIKKGIPTAINAHEKKIIDDIIIECDFVAACSMLVKRNVIETSG